MPANDLANLVDKTYPEYAYTAKPLVSIYDSLKGNKVVANLLIGEWVKIFDKSIPAEGRIQVRFRGGTGYVLPENLTRTRFLEVFFIDVDQGDSILIQTPDDRRVLIDGGQGDAAHTFIRRKYNLDDRKNYIDFEAIVATHSDKDHTDGLIKILRDPKIAVRRFYHNGLFRRNDAGSDPGPVVNKRVFGLVDSPALDASPALTSLMKRIIQAADDARKRLPDVIEKIQAMPRNALRVIQGPPPGGMVFKRLDSSDKFLPPFSPPPIPAKAVEIQVLWPTAELVNGQLSYPSYGEAGKTVNGNSIVLCLRYGAQRIMLTGDLNAKSMDDMVGKIGPELRSDVYKAAHHGSQDFSVGFLKAVQAAAAVISSGDDRDDVYGHPRAVLLGTITRYSASEKPAIFATELAACYSPIPLSKKQQSAFNEGRLKKYGGSEQVYEKSLSGVVHLRSDGDRLYLGTVHGRKPPDEDQAWTCYKWDIWPE